MKKLTRQDIEDLLMGAEILGCGGGGTVESGRELIDEVYRKGKEFRILDPTEIPDDALVFSVSWIGGGVSEDISKKVAKLPRISERPILVAARELSNYLHEEAFAFVPSEIGAGNLTVPLYTAAMTDKYAVDADYCGRAKPEFSISTTSIKKIPQTPLCLVSQFGDIAILKKTLNDYRTEDVCRYMAIISGGRCGVARLPTRGGIIRDIVVPNSVTKSVEIGRTIRKAKEIDGKPIDAFIKIADGFEIFHGRIRTYEREKKEAFMWGSLTIDGYDEYTNHTLRIWFKNEYLVSWKDKEPFVTCPDLLCVIDRKRARGLSNWVDDTTSYIGEEVVVVAVPASEIWRTEKGLEIFSPKHFGYQINYTPVEQLME